MTLLLQASGRGGGRMILPGMLAYPRGTAVRRAARRGRRSGPVVLLLQSRGAFSWASSMAQLVGGMSTARDRGTGR